MFWGFLVLVWVYRGFLFLSASSVILDMRLFFILCSDFLLYPRGHGWPMLCCGGSGVLRQGAGSLCVWCFLFHGDLIH